MKNKAPAELRFAAVAIDVVIFALKDGKLHVLLTDVDRPPHYTNIKGFPGGIIKVDEDADEAVARNLIEKPRISDVYTEQLYTFSRKDRDLRNRVISIAFLGLVAPKILDGYNIAGMHWTPVKEIKKLAYDHNEVFGVALERLQGRLTYTNIAQYLLPKHFTLTELQEVYDVVLNSEFDKRNFRKKILAQGIVEDTGTVQEGVRNRPAALYMFKEKKVQVLPLFA